MLWRDSFGAAVGMVEVALAGLYPGGFFNKAAFYGGTALRILHDLDRFSEDLDFSLRKHRWVSPLKTCPTKPPSKYRYLF